MMSQEEINTLYNSLEIESLRRTGRSTRLIDNYIQDLFTNKLINVQDHFRFGTDKTSNRLLFDRIVKRLKSEHSYLFMQDEYTHMIAILNFRDLSIELKEV